MQPAKPAHGSVILGTPFTQTIQLVIIFITPKPHASALPRKSNANFEFNFSHRGKNSMLDTNILFQYCFASSSLVFAISCEQLMI
jgi:branched-subunit amino acid permease